MAATNVHWKDSWLGTCGLSTVHLGRQSVSLTEAIEHAHTGYIGKRIVVLLPNIYLL